MHLSCVPQTVIWMELTFWILNCQKYIKSSWQSEIKLQSTEKSEKVLYLPQPSVELPFI